jgi:two-component system OmpR family response regulator
MTSRGACLVIEDDPDIGGLLETIISGMGFDVRLEQTGTESLLAATSDLALITLDLGLPDMDGREVAQILRRISNVPILMITAHAQPRDELEGMAAGANAYLPKPFRPAQLRTIVQKLCPEPHPAADSTTRAATTSKPG